MGKRLTKKQQEITPQQPPEKSACHRCGWVFADENHKRREYDPEKQPGKMRTEPRTEIRLGQVTWCGDCYERMMFETGQHTKIGSPAASVYRDALYSERRTLTPEEKERNRVAVSQAVEKLVQKFRVSP